MTREAESKNASQSGESSVENTQELSSHKDRGDGQFSDAVCVTVSGGEIKTPTPEQNNKTVDDPDRVIAHENNTCKSNEHQPAEPKSPVGISPQTSEGSTGKTAPDTPHLEDNRIPQSDSSAISVLPDEVNNDDESPPCNALNSETSLSLQPQQSPVSANASPPESDEITANEDITQINETENNLEINKTDITVDDIRLEPDTTIHNPSSVADTTVVKHDIDPSEPESTASTNSELPPSPLADTSEAVTSTSETPIVGVSAPGTDVNNQMDVEPPEIKDIAPETVPDALNGVLEMEVSNNCDMTNQVPASVLSITESDSHPETAPTTDPATTSSDPPVIHDSQDISLESQHNRSSPQLEHPTEQPSSKKLSKAEKKGKVKKEKKTKKTKQSKDEKDASKPTKQEKTNQNSSKGDNAEKEGVEEEESWDTLFDDTGDCLDDDLMKEVCCCNLLTLLLVVLIYVD